MASAARLERLRKLVISDLAALPDRPATPKAETETVRDSECSSVCRHPTVAPPSQSLPDKRSTRRELEHAPKPVASCEESTERRFVWFQGASSSCNLGSVPDLTPLPAAKLSPIDLRKGELALGHQHFTPIVALSKYPYKFCEPNWMQDIATAFFDGGKFWARGWDLYYVWDIDLDNPLILVRENQVEGLLGEINTTLKLKLRITDQQRETGLVSRFPNHRRCRPRYLGRSHSREEYDTMIDNVPSVSFRGQDEPTLPQLEGRTLEDFKHTMKKLWDLQKSKSKRQKEKKKMERIAKNKLYADGFMRAQRYLGLRPSAQDGQPLSGSPPAVDFSFPAPFSFDRSVVFLCVDVESYERAHHKITEIGIASFDTHDLTGLAPGKDGENWRAKIQARHFRIQENRHLVNTEFITGCPNSFYFGKSEWLSLADVPAVVGACFKPPFCARVPEAVDGSVSMADGVNFGEHRNLVFLGHDAATDVKYLQHAGFDPLDLPNLLEAQDTAAMYRTWRREQNPTQLGKILVDFDIPGFGIHNAGNDAVYTVQAMLGICVREASFRGTPGKKFRDEDKASKLTAAYEQMMSRTDDEAAGRSDHEADSDGGVPVAFVIKEKTKATKQGHRQEE